LCVYVLGDYTTDRRGDIGSMVREMAMYCIYNLVTTICNNESEEVINNYLNKLVLEKIVGNLLQQLTEKMDKMRLISGSILQRLCDNCFHKLPNFDQKDILNDIFSNEAVRLRVSQDQSRIDDKFDISL